MTKGVGTLVYGAPEQFDDDEEEVVKYDERVDVFSAGATLFKLGNLKPPFSGSEKVVLKKLLITEKKDKFAEFCPAKLRDLIDLCMIFDFQKRPTINVVVQELEDKFELELTNHQ